MAVFFSMIANFSFATFKEVGFKPILAKIGIGVYKGSIQFLLKFYLGGCCINRGKGKLRRGIEGQLVPPNEGKVEDYVKHRRP
jgi:hypothetical protein